MLEARKGGTGPNPAEITPGEQRSGPLPRLGERAEQRVREILTASGLDVPAGLGHHTVAQLSTLPGQAG